MAFMGDAMNPAPLWHNGPSPGAFYSFPANSTSFGPAKHTVSDFRAHSAVPITTTTTVIGLKYDKGCVIAADTLGSYGSLARFRDCPRVLKVNDLILLGSGGDYADYQYLRDIIEQKIIDEQCMGDGLNLKPKSLHCWLTRVLYNKRSKMDPLWSNYIVAGIQDGEPFLGAVDKLGTAYEDAAIATGLGAYMATPLLRDALEKGPLDEETAKNVVRKCMEVLFYRDARSFPRYQLGVVNAAGVTVSETVELKHDWTLAHMIQMNALVIYGSHRRKNRNENVNALVIYGSHRRKNRNENVNALVIYGSHRRKNRNENVNALVIYGSHRRKNRNENVNALVIYGSHRRKNRNENVNALVIYGSHRRKNRNENVK